MSKNISLEEHFVIVDNSPSEGLWICFNIEGNRISLSLAKARRVYENLGRMLESAEAADAADQQKK